LSAADSTPFDRAALAAAELRHYLRLATEIDEQGALRTAVRKRVAEVTGRMSPADQAWFVHLLAEMSKALRGAGAAGPAMQAVLQRVGDAQAGAANALTAPKRPYKLTSHGSVTVHLEPRMMASFVVSDVARSWKPAQPSGAHVAQLLAVAGRGLTVEMTPALLEAAQAAWRDGTYDSAWEGVIRKLNGFLAHTRPMWGLNQVGLLAAFMAEDRIDGALWLGPLKAHMHAVQMESEAWEVLLRHVASGDGGAKPGKTFAKTAAEKLADIGASAFRERVMGWLEAHPLDPALPDPDADALKQLIWMVGTTGPDAAAPLGRFAQRCFVKVPQIGARSVKLGNAALAALGMVEPPSAGAAELDRLRQRVKYPSAQKQIEAALQAAAKRAGLTAEDLAEMAVPDFDLQPDGTARAREAEGAVVLRLAAGSLVSLEWQDGAGKTVSAAPAALKKARPALVKEWTERKRALDEMLSGQISRIEGFFERDRAWEAAVWIQRYARHGLLGPLSRRLIWHVTRADGSTASMLPIEGRLVDAAGGDVVVGAGDRVRLWHPIDASVDEVLAWRASILARGLVQPFKQAHREIYRLTDAERETGTYSNRFGGHILRQHQMLALAKSRFWTGTLQGSFDGANDPTKTYAEHGLSVSFEAEGIDGHEGDLSPHGICLRVATGAVRFRKAAPAQSRAVMMASVIERARAARAGEAVAHLLPARPVRLEDVPTRLFSEAMRDVDLFVGVASLGADPAWEDGGPNGRFADYWRGYADADLMESGKARHAVLSAILPRLNIASVCTLEPRHLVVRGRLKTYRIHIGSGSIFFLPEGQYLCIVPARGAPQAEVALPFEGDGMLSAILSKAVLLARDDLIKDRTILTQLGRFG
jgi:hypothetical protein